MPVLKKNESRNKRSMADKPFALGFFLEEGH